MQVRCRVNHKSSTALQSAAASTSYRTSTRKSFPQHHLDFESVSECITQCITAPTCEYDRIYLVSQVVSQQIVIIISIFRALAVPFLSENSVICRAWDKLGKRQIQIGGKPMATRRFAYTCSLASTATILLASVAISSLAPAQTRG